MHSSRMRTDRTLTVFPYWMGISHFRENLRPPLKIGEKMGDPSEKWETSLKNTEKMGNPSEKWETPLKNGEKWETHL